MKASTIDAVVGRIEPRYREQARTVGSRARLLPAHQQRRMREAQVRQLADRAVQRVRSLIVIAGVGRGST
ncbi:MAG TPA: hypothetical protein VGH61_01585, partial [Steroidobacteraceae bacterium]